MANRVHKDCGGTVVDSFNFHKKDGQMIWYTCLTCGKEFTFGEDAGTVRDRNCFDDLKDFLVILTSRARGT